MLPIKICGLTRADDARLAWDLGAAALGFIFHPASPRYIAPESAARLREMLPDDAICVGVFVDRSANEVNRVIDLVGLDAAQLHGGESRACCAAIRRPVIKAIRAAPESVPSPTPPDVGDGHPAAAFLLDAWHPRLAGGTGQHTDWKLAKELAGRCRLILSGGLRPGDLRPAEAEVRPAALDLNSGVERAPGIKDPALLRAVFATANLGERPCLLA